ncbi:hypothetical protein ULMS_08770 [Patiriisocius marinistellae]|uniref:RHS repeat-associated core domain-containing protein n=2 Tax=Patiriisocius marinistellae TaxID=2494560 RepID=A0A5J4FYZ3_9FLAO|nr:hypothetical protein ULMS_08770 [Patiriisocius marinistellae]
MDNEIKGEGNSLNYKYRMHDPRVGRFFAIDPLFKKYPWNSSYAFSENRLIDGVELEGLEFYLTSNGEKLGKFGDDNTIRVMNNLYVDEMGVDNIKMNIHKDGTPGSNQNYILDFNSKPLMSNESETISKVVTATAKREGIGSDIELFNDKISVEGNEGEADFNYSDKMTQEKSSQSHNAQAFGELNSNKGGFAVTKYYKYNNTTIFQMMFFTKLDT